MSAEHFKLMNHAVDAVSAGAILGTMVGVLPPLAAFVAIVWYAIQIWESATVQLYVRAHRIKHRKRRVMREINTRHLRPHHRKRAHHVPPKIPGAPE